MHFETMKFGDSIIVGGVHRITLIGRGNRGANRYILKLENAPDGGKPTVERVAKGRRKFLPLDRNVDERLN